VESNSGPSGKTAPKTCISAGGDTDSADIHVIETTFILQEPNLTTSYHQNAEVTWQGLQRRINQ